MATSAGKTLGLILLVIIIIFLALKITPLLLAPLGIFSGTYHAIKTPGFESITFGPGGLRWSSFSFFSLVLLIIWIAVIVWVYRDAERRGMNGVLWALLVLIGNIIGLIIYLIVRSDSLSYQSETPPTQNCPSCNKGVPSSFGYCPHCGTQIQPTCPSCGKAVEKDWKACPHCGKKLKN
jgi:hypothetical protein